MSDTVVHLDVRRTWTDAIFASLGSSDGHVSDDEIFEILTAGRDGETAAERCAAKGVTVPMYCVWKAKYRGLSLEDLRKARRGERWRARCVVGVLVAAAALGAGGIVFGLARAAQADVTVAAALPPAPLPATPMNPAALGGRQPESAVDAAPAEAPAPAEAEAPAPPTEPRFNVQVAAAVSLEQGRVLVDRLTAAGHPAYVLTATVKNVEVFRVRVGPFDTLPEAEDVSLQLQRNGYPAAWIVR